MPLQRRITHVSSITELRRPASWLASMLDLHGFSPTPVKRTYGAFEIEVARTPEALMASLGDWENLVEAAIESNPFYEPWMLMPALRHLRPGDSVAVVLVFAVVDGVRQLCGLFPLERKMGFHGLPIPTLQLWRHKYCPLCTPLVRAGAAVPTLAAFFDWLSGASTGCLTMGFNLVRADGPFREALLEALAQTKTRVFEDSIYGRALFRPAADARTFLDESVPQKKRKELRRLERRLGELGRVEYDSLTPTSAVEKWIDEFLQLEATGWKGRTGSALGTIEAVRSFFTSAAMGAHRRGRLMMLALRLDGQAIAMKCNFVGSSGGYAIRIAFDEAFARYSPGVLLELANIRECHARADVPWMDSCALPDHPMIDHLWRAQRRVGYLTVSTGRYLGDLFVSSMPMLRSLKHTLQKATGYRP